jgi:S-formylglutathione hydrolase FrmB
MFASGVPPFVLAAPTGSGDAHGDTEWADSVDGRDLVERYVVGQVIPAVEGAHRRDRMHRIITGFSMGGFGAANLALRHPDVFGGAASISGYFHIDDPDEVFGANSEVEDRNDPEVLVTRVRNVQFWLAVGDHDDEPAVRGEAQRFAALLGNRLDPDDLVVASGTHSIGFVVSQFPALGAFVAKVSGSLGNGAIRPG